MRTAKEIKLQIRKIKADDRYPKRKKDIAIVLINAPLALIQVDMQAKVKALE